jgi:coenzyme PQQ precursor peptide PqqA
MAWSGNVDEPDRQRCNLPNRLSALRYRAMLGVGGFERHVYLLPARHGFRFFRRGNFEKETNMAWTTPILSEICIGLEINGYLPAEF